MKRFVESILFSPVITGPPTHNVGARLVTVAGVCRPVVCYAAVGRVGGRVADTARRASMVTSR